MVMVYILAVLISAMWLARMITSKKIIFRRTILDIPLIIFLLSQVISAYFSIDPRTSLLGYYSRFNGGVFSLISYSLLYWAFVANIDQKTSLFIIKSSMFVASLVSIYAILEHFGFSISCLVVRGEFNTNCWVQDVKTRVFATLGQPNWLAAYLVALMPIAWSNTISNFQFPISNLKKNFWLILSAILFTALLFTKSRSGLLGLLTASVIFWTLIYLKTKFTFLKEFILVNSLFVILSLVIGTPWNSSLWEIQNPDLNQQTSLETGGTESGEIRKIVWKGAIDIWKHNLAFGTGPETFAFAYYQFKPQEHNLTSEWDFLYNKAHNEYLNYLANTGTVGLIPYLVLILFSILTISNFQFLISKQAPIFKFKNSKHSLGQLEQLEISHFHIAILAGFTSILITNFFGFSVVVTNLLFFLFPAFAVAVANSQQSTTNFQLKELTTKQKILLLIVGSCVLFVVFGIAKYWYADFLYEKGKQSLDHDLKSSLIYLAKAIEISPNEAIFHAKLAESYSKTGITELTDFTLEEIDKAILLSPYNLNIKRVKYNILLELSLTDKKYGLQTVPLLIQMASLAPTDAKINYNLGISYQRVGGSTQAIEVLEKVTGLKPNYRNARLALALIYIKEGKKDKAKEELKYILEKIDPNDSLVKEELEKI
ncbi:MAG: O-antigen ligase family protein [Patescibacteria group bacterium]